MDPSDPSHTNHPSQSIPDAAYPTDSSYRPGGGPLRVGTDLGSPPPSSITQLPPSKQALQLQLPPSLPQNHHHQYSPQPPLGSPITTGIIGGSSSSSSSDPPHDPPPPYAPSPGRSPMTAAPQLPRRPVPAQIAAASSSSPSSSSSAAAAAASGLPPLQPSAYSPLASGSGPRPGNASSSLPSSAAVTAAELAPLFPYPSHGSERSWQPAMPLPPPHPAAAGGRGPAAGGFYNRGSVARASFDGVSVKHLGPLAARRRRRRVICLCFAVGTVVFLVAVIVGVALGKFRAHWENSHNGDGGDHGSD